MAKHALCIALLVIVSGIFAGCSGSDSGVTKKEEEDFRNPPKGGIPPHIQKQMEESREKGMKKAAEMRGQK